MIINKQQHKKMMLDILSDISSDPILAINLGFKGGTCVYFLYSLDRFSVDLDFDLLDIEKKEEALNRLDLLLVKYGKVSTDGTMRRKVKYSEESATLKVDVSDRIEINALNTYEVKDIVSGVPLKILSKKDIFAHKLVAISNRYNNKTTNKVITNRDLYDVNFFFDNKWAFNEKIIELRVGKKAVEYLADLKKLIEDKVDAKKILDGIGALVDDKKRLWVRRNLKQEVLKKLSLQIESMRE
jgi:predicted nucleotidyltransferase component of viral defense system